MMLVLKIPILYLCAVVWWAVRAEPRPLEGAALPVAQGRARALRSPPTAASPAAAATPSRVRPFASRGARQGPPVTHPRALERERPAEIVAGFLASASIFMSFVGLAYRPLRLIPLALLLAFVAAAMASGRSRRLAAVAAGLGALCFAAGMAIAVLAEHPLF